LSYAERFKCSGITYADQNPGHVPEVIKDMGLAVEIARRLGEE